MRGGGQGGKSRETNSSLKNKSRTTNDQIRTGTKTKTFDR